MSHEQPQALADDILIRSGTLEDFPRIGPLWSSLYQNQREQRMLVEVPANGFESWCASMKVAFGRFSCLYVAQSGANIIGFLAGRIRMMPSYFGGLPVGFLSEIYILEQYRKQGVARSMMIAGLEWCKAQQVTRIEAQILIDNVPSRKMCAQLGAVEELVQVVWRP